MTKVFAAVFGALVVIGVVSVVQPKVLAARAPGSRSGELRIVASIYPVGYLAGQIAGGADRVEVLTPAGSEPHEYAPTARQMIDIQTADVLILNGGIEPWGDTVRELVDPRRTIVVTAGEGLESLSREGDAAVADPHVWLSPRRAAAMASTIEAGIERADPARVVQYRQNAAVLEQRLADLDAAYARGLSRCQSRTIVTAHAAFGYLAADYGLAQVSIAGLSPDAEPSSRQLIDIAAMVTREQVSTIFFESLASPKLAQVIARETGAQVAMLDPLEGEPGGAAVDYFTVMEDNLRTLQKALICTS
jgi:zinc transport system substrate-binding protein